MVKKDVLRLILLYKEIKLKLFEILKYDKSSFELWENLVSFKGKTKGYYYYLDNFIEVIFFR